MYDIFNSFVDHYKHGYCYLFDFKVPCFPDFEILLSQRVEKKSQGIVWAKKKEDEWAVS